MADQAYELLTTAGIATEENRARVRAYRNIPNLVTAMLTLSKNNCLNEDSFIDLTKVPSRVDRVAFAFVRLAKAAILTSENRAVLLDEEQPNQMADLLCTLQKAKLLTPENREVVRKLGSGTDAGIKHLMKAKLATQENFNLLTRHGSPYSLAKGLALIAQEPDFSPADIESILGYDDPASLAAMMVLLKKARIFNEKNNAVLLASTHADQLHEHLLQLDKMGLLTQEHFEGITRAELERGEISDYMNLFLVKKLYPAHLASIETHPQQAILCQLIKSLHQNAACPEAVFFNYLLILTLSFCQTYGINY